MSVPFVNVVTFLVVFAASLVGVAYLSLSVAMNSFAPERSIRTTWRERDRGTESPEQQRRAINVFSSSITLSLSIMALGAAFIILGVNEDAASTRVMISPWAFSGVALVFIIAVLLGSNQRTEGGTLNRFATALVFPARVIAFAIILAAITTAVLLRLA